MDWKIWVSFLCKIIDFFSFLIYILVNWTSYTVDIGGFFIRGVKLITSYQLVLKLRMIVICIFSPGMLAWLEEGHFKLVDNISCLANY
jgi:hypothetical protein